jgi:hypothetical protein
MKKLLLLLVSIAFFSTTNTNAQVSVNVNVGTPPVWAPAERVETQYYYLPEIDTYYDVPQRKYIYLSNNGWVRSSSLPARHRNYNLRGGEVVYITDYRGNSPYVYHKKHKTKYYHPSNHGNHKSNGKGKGHGKKNHYKK